MVNLPDLVVNVNMAKVLPLLWPECDRGIYSANTTSVLSADIKWIAADELAIEQVRL